MSQIATNYSRPWVHRLKWAYVLLVVFFLMLPVFYTIHISFNEYGFGSPLYTFTTAWYTGLLNNAEIGESLKWTLLLGVLAVVTTVPMALLAAKFYKRTRFKVSFVILMLFPLFVPGDIMGASLLVFFKNLNNLVGWAFGADWFELSVFTALVGQVLWCFPYAFVVILIAMSRYRQQQTEAARSCGATAWQAFWHVEFPQIRAGIFPAATFVFILSFNEYIRTDFLAGGFDTFNSFLYSYMLNTGMSPEVYAMGSLVSLTSIVVIGGVIFYLFRQETRSLQAEPRARASRE
jgi:ABC-type spermidine/putrescine transport system permease subunit II